MEEVDVQGHAHTAEAVVAYMGGAFDSYPEQEQFWVLFLNRRNMIKGRLMITLGTLSSTLCAPREVFRAAVLASAAAIIVVHNHPSGVMPHPVLCRTAPSFHSEFGHRHAA